MRRGTLLALALVAAGLAVASSPARAEALLPADARQTAVAVSRILRACFLGDALLLALAAVIRWRPSPGLGSDVTGLRDAAEERGAARWALPAIVFGGLLLRLPGLGSQLWLDEVATLVTYLREPWTRTFALYESANQHLLYSVLGSLSVHTFGESAWAARLPALVFGVAGVWAIAWLAGMVATRRESLLAAALLAVSWHHIWFSQDARGYSGMVLATCAGTALLFRAVATNRAGVWLAYAVVMALGVATLQNTAFVAAGHLVGYAAAIVARRVPFSTHGTVTRNLTGALALSAYLSLHLHALVLPRIVWFMRNADVEGLAPTGISAMVPAVTSGLRAGLGIAAALAFLAFMAMAIVGYVRQSPLFAVSAVAPALVNAGALAVIGYRGYPRSFLYVLPFALILAARGASLLDERIAKRFSKRPVPLAGMTLVVLSMVPLPSLYLLPKQDYLGALRFARSQRHDDECIASIGLAAMPYSRYYAPDLDFPQDDGGLRRLEARCSRVWLLYTLPDDLQRRFPEIRASIRSRYEPAASFPGTVGDGSVVVARSRLAVNRSP